MAEFFRLFRELEIKREPIWACEFVLVARDCVLVFSEECEDLTVFEAEIYSLFEEERLGLDFFDYFMEV